MFSSKLKKKKKKKKRKKKKKKKKKTMRRSWNRRVPYASLCPISMKPPKTREAPDWSQARVRPVKQRSQSYCLQVSRLTE